jgi:ATP-dependent 26S proteasome regulatory subunit
MNMTETTDVKVPMEASPNISDQIDYNPTDLAGMITSLNDQITTLRMQNSEFQARLLEAMTINKNLQQQLLALKKHIEDSTKPPLFLASVLEVSEGEALIRQHGNNQEWLIERGEHELDVGMRVAVNNDLKIIRTLVAYSSMASPAPERRCLQRRWRTMPAPRSSRCLVRSWCTSS